MDLIERLNAAIDAEEAKSWPHRPTCQMLKPVPPGFPFGGFSCNCDATTLWHRTVEAHREIVKLYEGTRTIRETAYDILRQGGTPTDIQARDANQADRELAALQVVVEAVAAIYGIEA